MSDDATTALRVFARLVAEELQRLGASPAAAGTATWRAVDDVAASLKWTPRHLREFCVEHGVAIAGTRKAPLVDGAALERAITGTARTPVHKPRARRDVKPANETHPELGLDAGDLATLARSGVRVVGVAGAVGVAAGGRGRGR
ncbi:MAG: hypothetical protein WCJ30_02700 [Deltaproteobacteria bacterium]